MCPVAEREAARDLIPLTVTDLKQYLYCSRIPYFQHVLALPRPVTFKMKHGTLQHLELDRLEKRRGLRSYGLREGQRMFHVQVSSQTLGLHGVVDLVVAYQNKGDNGYLPIEFKHQEGPIHTNVKYQLAAYAMMLEETHGTSVADGVVYQILWGETAILLQTRTHLGVISRTLQDFGIPYVIQEDNGFWKCQEVQDLLHLLRVLEDPEDAISLLGFLRGPLVRLPDSALWAIGRTHGLVQGFWQTEIEGLVQADEQLVQAAKAALDRRRNALSKNRVSDWLSHLLYTENVEAQIGNRSLAALVDMAEEGEEHGAFSLAAQLAWWRELEASQEKISGGNEASVPHAVRIMTIHAAKGLEFPVVCLPDLTHRQSAMMKRFHLCEENGLVTKALPAHDSTVWVPTLAYDAAAQVEKRALTEEKKRLFYVGLTRAQQKVILSGAASAFSEKRSLEECSNWWDWLPFLLPELRENGLRDGKVTGRGWNMAVLTDQSVPEYAVRAGGMEEQGGHVGDGSEASVSTISGEADMTRWLSAKPATIWRVTELADRLTGGAMEAVRPAWPLLSRQQSLLPHECGQVVHGVFEHLTSCDDEQTIRERRLPAALARLGYADARLAEEVWERIRGDLGVYLKHDLHREMMGSLVCEHELPFVTELVEGVRVSGVIDAAWLRVDGRATVVDYKTRACESERHVAEMVERYGVQVQMYAAVVERLLGWQVDRVGMYLTTLGRFVEVEYGERVKEELMRKVIGVVKAGVNGDGVVRGMGLSS